ncbi:hypothetical protein KVT40_004791 [Elsinoe batatas]|uniref:Uncharacterized protein n=1 Tax=Elsinoe batatas TaxID=2601811 RepID=A0A8K0L7T7_9PEZI|nr:hypothetical protein KVT40_004791 [Elsinoe batatas]
MASSRSACRRLIKVVVQSSAMANIVFSGTHRKRLHIASRMLSDDYRWLYDLMHTATSQVPTASSLEASNDKLRKALTQWRESIGHVDFEDVDCLCWQLDHDSIEGDLCLASLQDPDAKSHKSHQPTRKHDGEDQGSRSLQRWLSKVQWQKAGAQDAIDTWSSRLMKQVLAETRPTDGADGETLLKFCVLRPELEFFEHIIPWARQWSSRSSFIISFLAHWTQNRPKFTRQDNLNEEYANLAVCCAQSLQTATLGSMQREEPRPRWSYGFDPSKDDDTPKGQHRIINYVDPEAMVKVVKELIAIDRQDVVGALLNPFALRSKEPCRLAGQLHDKQILPLLTGLAYLAVRSANALRVTGELQAVFSFLVSSYLQHYVQREPAPPSDWKKPPVKCVCRTCLDVSKFMRSPHQREYRVKAPENIRKHVDSGTYGKDVDSHTDKANGTPYTLILTKNHQSHDYNVEQWKRRASEAYHKLAAIHNLQGLLPREDKHLATLDGITDSLSLNSRRPLDGQEDSEYSIAIPEAFREPLQERRPRFQGRIPTSSIPAKRTAETGRVGGLDR